MHFVVMIFKIPFPGYDAYAAPASSDHKVNELSTTITVKNGDGTTYFGAISETDPLVPKSSNKGQDEKSPQTIPVWMYFFLAIPAIFDLGATALCMMGLQYIDVSIYQLLRGSGTLVPCLMSRRSATKKYHVCNDPLLGLDFVYVCSFGRVIMSLTCFVFIFFLQRDYFCCVDETVCSW